MVPLSHNDGANVDGLILKGIPNWKTKMAQNSGGQSPNVSPNESTKVPWNPLLEYPNSKLILLASYHSSKMMGNIKDK